MSEENNHIEAEEPSAPAGRPSPIVLVIASMFLTAPACIPFYFAIQQEDATLRWVFIGAGFSIVIFNAVALVLIYRWIQRINHS